MNYYKIAIATGLGHEAALRFEEAMKKREIDIYHLTAKQMINRKPKRILNWNKIAVFVIFAFMLGVAIFEVLKAIKNI